MARSSSSQVPNTMYFIRPLWNEKCPEKWAAGVPGKVDFWRRSGRRSVLVRGLNLAVKHA